ncbi:MAG TPA: 3-oxoacyl-[acyl-carrier-protein] reductase [Candidatus Monoglobus merdigallinarum]|uniref:3-oxoacyl-[acyl-carrier-protein] reductase n=1 Tax=Candidatus Monoglobus merdigallinarum TaxID=2838698 RepID=A0A9D1TM62_9FIRM|nr:3-oxoacyl-[acyl-carrier-protein] reductase [Candidatus Monoglobus merdigallinarum]
MEFKDKCVIVTGSARGIGREIALKFGAECANVVVFDINIDGQAEVAQKVCDEIKTLGGDAEYFLGDVSKPEDTDALIKFAVEKFGGIDVLVNNAGITRDNLIMRMSEADWDAVLTVNLKGAFNVIKSATRTLMKQRRGVIINMASVSGVMGNAGQANYSASKAGLIGLTKSVAKELASRNIRCNAIAPGFIQTPMTDKLSEEIQQTYKDAIPLRHFGQVEDIANLAVFLGSEKSKYITGQVINVDGGLVM